MRSGLSDAPPGSEGIGSDFEDLNGITRGVVVVSGITLVLQARKVACDGHNSRHDLSAPWGCLEYIVANATHLRPAGGRAGARGPRDHPGTPWAIPTSNLLDPAARRHFGN